MLDKLKNLFLEESARWVLWFPVFLGLGIALYFKLPYEPSMYAALRPLALAITLFVLVRRRLFALKALAIILMLVSLGFAAAKYRAEAVKSPVIPVINHPVTLSANIQEISYSSGFPALILENIRIDEIPKYQTPTKIRLNVRTKFKEEVIPGDRIITDTILAPPTRPAIAGGYDFRMQSYFDQIGATGFAIRQIVKLKQGGVDSRLEKMRFAISKNIRGTIEGDTGAISEALINGQRTHISTKVYDDMKRSGLAHLLAVSGMNLALVGGMLFFAVRFLLSLIPHFAEARPIKKYAAIIAIIANFGYLLISGSTVSAQRAFVMVSLIMLGVVMDRAVTPMRSVAFAAFVILLVEPESLFNAGFQMSFAAVIALISVYEIAMKKIFVHQEDDYREGQRWYAKLHNKIWLYPVSIMFTSLIAGLATAPFAAYHFNQVSNYHGVLANLLAVPIVSFWVTPFSIIAMLLMPFGLHWVGLVPMSYGVEVIIWISAHISAIKDSSKMVLQMPDWGLICIIMGGLWFLLWSRSWRYLGLAGIVAGVLSFQFVTLPDIIINENGKLYAVNYDGKLYLPYFRKSFASKSWLEEFGQKEMLRLPKQENYEVKGQQFGFGCAGEGSFSIDQTCITAADLAAKGTHNIYLNNDEIVVKTVEENKLPRIWTKKYVRNSWNHQ